LAEQFAREGHSVLVVTSWQPGLPVEETIRGVRVYRVGMRPLERLRRWLSASRLVDTVRMESRKTETSAELESHSGTAARILRILNHVIWRNLWWPDSACIWIRPALRTARALLSEKPADVVISVSPAFSAVVAGYILARDCRGCRRWMIDLGDPFSFLEQAPSNNFSLYRRLNQWVEQRAFLRANAVSVTTNNTREIYSRLYPACAGKITAIPPLLPPSPESASSKRFFQNNDTTRLVYIGTLYRNLRRPDFLLQILCSMLRTHPSFHCELHLIGDTQECRESLLLYSKYLGERLVIHAPVERDLATQAMTEADILINLGNDTTFQLPSKLIEYTATGKRVISISCTASDSSTAFLRDYPNALCLQDQGSTPSDDQIAKFVSFCEDHNRCTVDKAVRKNFLHPFNIQTIASRYNALFASPERQLHPDC
jgi:hypothetical protein